MSNDGQRYGSNLRNESYCRLCHTVEQRYSEAFLHSAELRCLLVLPEFAIKCPLNHKCGQRFTAFNAFEKHLALKEFRKDWWVYIKFDNNVIRYKKESKAKTTLWQLEIVKKLYEGRDEASKLFLPRISDERLTAHADFKLTYICPFTVCVNIGQTEAVHQHKWETLANGRCAFCGNYHPHTGRRTRQRVCKLASFAGSLPR